MYADLCLYKWPNALALEASSLRISPQKSSQNINTFMCNAPLYHLIVFITHHYFIFNFIDNENIFIQYRKATRQVVDAWLTNNLHATQTAGNDLSSPTHGCNQPCSSSGSTTPVR